MMEANIVLELKKVSYSILNTKGEKIRTLFTDIDLTVSEEESIAIFGVSGAGKTSLLNLMGGLDQPDTGEIWIDGIQISTLSVSQSTTLRRDKIGFLFQYHHLLPQFTVWENILLPTLSLSKEKRKGKEERARRLLTQIGLDSRRYAFPGELSGGECQRIALVRSLINQPRLLLADEPTGSLDYRTAIQVIDLLFQLQKEEKFALVIATHALFIAERTNRSFLLQDGILNPIPPEKIYHPQLLFRN